MDSVVSSQDLLRWSEALAGVAKTGLGFTSSLYERERFEEVLKIAADIRFSATTSTTEDPEFLVEQWKLDVGIGVEGYATPKVAIGAIVGNDKGQLLLVQRRDSGVWLYPTGWADMGYSASEVVVKEVKEETGIDVKPSRLVAVFDGLRRGFGSIALYLLIFQCEVIGGELQAHPLECADVGWFDEQNLPEPLAGQERWKELAFAALRQDKIEVLFDPPRFPLWRS